MQFYLRLIAELVRVSGEAPRDTEDLTVEIDGFKIQNRKTVTLAPADTDTLISFTDASAILVLTHDAYPFRLRLADGETLIDNLFVFVAGGNDKSKSALSDGVLLSGNTTNTVQVEIWVIEKVA